MSRFFSVVLVDFCNFDYVHSALRLIIKYSPASSTQPTSSPFHMLCLYCTSPNIAQCNKGHYADVLGPSISWNKVIWLGD